MEGKFEVQEPKAWAPGERNAVIRRSDNLQVTGEFEQRQKAEFVTGERSSMVRHEDNLTTTKGIEENRKEWASDGSCLFQYLASVF